MSEFSLTQQKGGWLPSKMRESRRFNESINPIYPTDVLETPLHLCIGQEAVPVGVCAYLNPKDTIFFGHRTTARP